MPGLDVLQKMKHHLIPILAIAFGVTFASCNKSNEDASSSDKSDSALYDDRIIGTWKYVGESSYMKIEVDGTFSYSDDLTSDPGRVGKWTAPTKDLIEARFDWLEDAKRKSPEEAERIRKAIEERPEDRYGIEKFSAVIGDNDDILLTSFVGAGGRVTPWERVKE